MPTIGMQLFGLFARNTYPIAKIIHGLLAFLGARTQPLLLRRCFKPYCKYHYHNGDSPLFRSIFPAADSEKLFSEDDDRPDSQVRISMATVVDGILRLISRNPKEDRNTVRRTDNQDIGRMSLLPVSGSPLRQFYLDSNDKGIYDLLCNYFTAVKRQSGLEQGKVPTSSRPWACKHCLMY